eukprot:6703956-Pyramimonas_sp.AAC.1
MGWKGARAAARPSGRGEGNQCGLAILAPARVPITQPPSLPAPSFADGRAVAGHVRWGVPGGFIYISLYVFVNEGWSDRNVHALRELCSFPANLNHAGDDWTVGGDFNMEAQELADTGWIQALGG